MKWSVAAYRSLSRLPARARAAFKSWLATNMVAQAPGADAT